MTTDYSAHDIHRLDQAYPDALADIERFTGNPANKNRLAEVGPEVYAAELTRDLAVSTDNPMSLAGWAAIATVRLMDAGKAWEEDTEMAYDQLDAARAMADELRAELEKVRGQHADTRRHNDLLTAELADQQRANTAHANENAELRKVVEAAARWVESWDALKGDDTVPFNLAVTGSALAATVRALPKPAGVAR